MAWVGSNILKKKQRRKVQPFPKMVLKQLDVCGRELEGGEEKGGGRARWRHCILRKTDLKQARKLTREETKALEEVTWELCRRGFNENCLDKALELCPIRKELIYRTWFKRFLLCKRQRLIKWKDEPQDGKNIYKKSYITNKHYSKYTKNSWNSTVRNNPVKTDRPRP